jgi:hypothetical protein
MNETGGGGRRRFAHQAASASLAMPVITMLLAGVWQANRIEGNKALLGLLCMFLIGAGTVLAIVALCGSRTDDGGGLVRRGVIGLVFNGVFVALFGLAFVSGFSRGVKARQAQRDLLRTAENVRENTRKSFDPKYGLTNAHTEDVTRLRQQMEKASTDFKGQDAILAKAWAAYLREIEVASQRWQALYRELGEAKVLDFGEVKDRQELRERQELVLRYKAGSDAMRDLVVNSADFFRGQLKQLGAAPGKREEAVKTLQAQMAQRGAVVLQIRDLDTRMSDDMLGVLTLLEKNWGRWTCPTGTVMFEEPRTLREYNALIADLRTAGKEQIDAQKKLVSLR